MLEFETFLHVVPRDVSLGWRYYFLIFVVEKSSVVIEEISIFGFESDYKNIRQRKNLKSKM